MHTRKQSLFACVALYLFTADFQLFAGVDYHKRADADGNGTYDKSRNYNQHAESVSQFAESRDKSVFQHYYDVNASTKDMLRIV